MFKNYIKTASRNLQRGKMFSAINIFGLAVGLAVCTLIALFVTDELNYDRYNENANNIYRINVDIKVNGNRFYDHTTPAPMAAALMQDYPQIEQAARLQQVKEFLLKKGDETVAEQNVFAADANLFKVFTLPLLHGNSQTALSQPNTMVMSETAAKKYFGRVDVVGKTILVNNTTPYEITGVIKNTPAQSHLHFDVIYSMASDESSKSDFWLNNNYDTYVLVKNGVTAQQLDSYLMKTAQKYAEPQLKDILKTDFEGLKGKGDYFRYSSIALTDIHLHSHLNSEIEPQGSIQYVYIFSIIGVFILLIACINFMNLSTARSSGRAREVGVRKVLGSNKKQLRTQFLTESVLTCLISLVFALLITIFLLPYFNNITGKTITTTSAALIWLIPTFVGLAIIIGFLAGIYPAFYLSAFQPVKVLKGKLSTGFKGGWLRNSLVVFQFAISVFLITGTIVIYKQMEYIRNRDTGYNREQVLVVRNIYSLGEQANIFKNEVLKIPGVINATRSSALPTQRALDWNKNHYSKDASLSANQSVMLNDWLVDADYIKTMGMQMSAGRNFSPDLKTDSNAVIINETAARILNYKNPLNVRIYSGSKDFSIDGYSIVGVVKDFNAGSMRFATEPMILRLSTYGDYFSIRIKGNNLNAVIANVRKVYHTMNKMSGQPFLYSFMDDDFNMLYQSELRMGNIFAAFAIFAIGIACLGLFGLIAYATEQRTREFGIRKVLGAKATDIITLLSNDFFKLIALSFLIAFPLSWFLMHKWLLDFAYRTKISWWVFVASGAIALVIAMVTIYLQTFKTATANPVKSLKTE